MTDANYCSNCGKELLNKNEEICPSCNVRIKDVSRLEKKYVGFGTRFAAYIIDIIIIWILGFFVGFIYGSFGNVDILGIYLITIVLFFLYFALLESSSFQATLGKRVLKIIVTNEQFGKISFGQALIRRIFIIIPILNIITAITIDYNEKMQGWHDKAAKTFVIFK